MPAKIRENKKLFGRTVVLKQFFMILFACLLCSNVADGADGADRQRKNPRRYPPQIEGAEVFLYKTVDQLELNLYVIKPSDSSPREPRPAIVFFFGGAWRNGTPEQFVKQGNYFASRGMVAILVDYRVYARHRSTVVQSIADAKSAIRWVRKNADRLGIDPDRIVASGGSAGGHLAVSAGVIPGMEEVGEEISISSQPNALVLFNPVMAMAPIEGVDPLGKRAGEIRRRIGDDPIKVCPLHHVQKDQPPAILFFGTNDGLLAGAQHFVKTSKKAGNRCELLTWEGRGHGFFNYGRSKNESYVETLRAADKFLASLGYLDGEPTVADNQ